MTRRRRTRLAPRADYTTVGHVTIDVLEDGSTRPGGSAFYSALQAARLGARALVVTSGVPREIEEMLAPYAGELELAIVPAEQTTTLATRGRDTLRSQRLLAWAGPLPSDLEVDTEILHLAPVARELPSAWRGEHSFAGLTPQGLLRRWSEPAGPVTLASADADALALTRRCDAVVLGAEERPFSEELIATARAHGAVVSVTDGPRPNVVLEPGAGELVVDVAALPTDGDDLGAGDVYAAAFFIGLAAGEQPLVAAAMGNAAASQRLRGAGAEAIGIVSPANEAGERP